VTNISPRPIWFRGMVPQIPSYRLFIRSKASARWSDQTEPLCGVFMEFDEIAPGASSSFDVSVPEDEVGHQLRVEVPIYSAPHYVNPIAVSSEAIPIK
jgi:hypothetical protein